MKNLLLRNKALTAGIAVLVIAALSWLAFGFFGIHTAFVDDVVNEDGPVFDVVASSDVATPVPQTAPLDTPAEIDAAPAPDAPAAPEPGPEPTPAAQADGQAEAPAPSAVQSPPPAVDRAELASESEIAAPPAVAVTPVAEATAVPVPTATPAPAPTPEPTPEPQTAPGEIVTQFSGNFQSLNGYSVSGTASVLNNGTEQRFLRLENFASDNGPDLKVYLRAANGDFVSLGDLSGNIGNQNYEIPVGVDLNVFNSVEIWCERFSRGFGAAGLNAA